MTRKEARELSQTRKFTKKELYECLKRALEELPESFWTKRNRSNKSTDNGFYFNFCVKLLGYTPGIDDEHIEIEMVAFRVLHIFGDFLTDKPLKKPKRVLPPITMSQKPKL